MRIAGFTIKKRRLPASETVTLIDECEYHEITAAYDDVVNLEVVRWRTALGRLRHRLRLGRK